MARRYYINEQGPEFEAVERWENEGGRLFQNQHRDQVVMPIVRPVQGEDNAKSVTGQTVRVDGIRFEI
jgi:hypothetical protein